MRFGRRICATLVALVFAHAEGQPWGAGPQGMTGGLYIPDAHVLSEHSYAASYGNFREPRFGDRLYERNFTVGIGFLPNVELFTRFADYTDTPSGDYLRRGPRDLSANFKVQVPYLPERGPQAAFGMTDVTGNILFESWYGVVTQEWLGFAVSVGYTQRTDRYEGVFGGVQWTHAPSGISLLAEHDGEVAYTGGRWFSPPLSVLGGLQTGATLLHSHGAEFRNGENADDLRFGLHLYWSHGRVERRRRDFVASATPAFAAERADRADRDQAADVSEPTPRSVGLEDLVPLRKTLEAAGFERVQTGLQGDPAHPDLVVKYENHRYALNEVDALGVVLGIASESVPAAIQDIRVVTLKDGLALYETRVSATAWRGFLRGGASIAARDGLSWRGGGSAGSDRDAEIRWERDEPGSVTRARITLRPHMHQTLGTEVGAFDYSLAAVPTLVAPLWPGARVTAAYAIPIHQTENIERVWTFRYLQHEAGLKTISLGQSVWLGDHALAHVALGRFHHRSWGAQSELRLFVPGTTDIVRARGVAYLEEPGRLEGRDHAGAVSYRRMWGPSMWTELGWQLYGDGTAGPTFEWTRWSGDLGVTFFVRQGGVDRFGGITLTVPLTPRRGMSPYPVTLAGPPRHAQSLRTMIHSESGANFVRPTWVRELVLETSLDDALFNGGRMSERYLRAQVDRMREAFHVYGRQSLPATE